MLDAWANTDSECSLAFRLNSLTLEDEEELFKDEWLAVEELEAIALVVDEVGGSGDMDRLGGKQHAQSANKHNFLNYVLLLCLFILLTFEWKRCGRELMSHMCRNEEWLQWGKSGRCIGCSGRRSAQHIIDTSLRIECRSELNQFNYVMSENYHKFSENTYH